MLYGIPDAITDTKSQKNLSPCFFRKSKSQVNRHKNPRTFSTFKIIGQTYQVSEYFSLTWHFSVNKVFEQIVCQNLITLLLCVFTYKPSKSNEKLLLSLLSRTSWHYKKLKIPPNKNTPEGWEHSQIYSSWEHSVSEDPETEIWPGSLRWAAASTLRKTCKNT